MLDDSFQAALMICDRNEKGTRFQQFKTEITNIQSHIFHLYMIELAIVAAAKSHVAFFYIFKAYTQLS